jgi:hypothetical protein
MGYRFLLDLARQVTNVLPPEHGGTGSTYGEQRVVVRGLNVTGSAIALYSLVQWKGGSNDARITLVADLDSTKVVGVVVGYYDGAGDLVEADCPSGYVAAMQTAGVAPVLIESAVTRGEYAFAAATDGTAYSSSTAAAGAFGRFVDSADVANGDPYARVQLPLTAAVGGGGGTFGTPALTLSTTNAAGSASTGVRTDATVAVFDTTAPVTQAFGDSAAAGSAGKAARRDHRHGMPSGDGTLTVVVNNPAAGVVVDVEMPFAGSWQSWRVFNDSAGSIQYDVWRDTYANFPPTVADTISGTDKPKTTSAAKAESTSLTGWTTPFSAGEVIRVNVDSTSGGLVRSVLSLRFTR